MTIDIQELRYHPIDGFDVWEDEHDGWCKYIEKRKLSDAEIIGFAKWLKKECERARRRATLAEDRVTLSDEQTYGIGIISSPRIYKKDGMPH